jgi:hypothetical protein
MDRAASGQLEPWVPYITIDHPFNVTVWALDLELLCQCDQVGCVDPWRPRLLRQNA